MPSYKLLSQSHIADKKQKKSKKLLSIKQYGGTDIYIRKDALLALATNGAMPKGTDKLYKNASIPDELKSKSEYAGAHINERNYKCVSMSGIVLLIEINPMPTNLNDLKVYVVEKTEDDISATGGYPVLKKLVNERKDNFIYNPTDKVGKKLSEETILDTDNKERKYTNSNLYESIYARMKSLPIAASPKNLKTLHKLHTPTPIRPLSAASGTSGATPVARGSAVRGIGANSITKSDLDALFVDGNTAIISDGTELTNIDNGCSNLYDAIAITQVTHIARYNSNGNTFYLAKRITHARSGATIPIAELTEDYYILKKFYGRDDILVICMMPRPASGNINLGQPNIYEDSTDLVVDYDRTTYNHRVQFPISHVLLNCLKLYIKVMAEENDDQSKLDSYEDYYFSSAVPAGAGTLQNHFNITPELSFQSHPIPYEFLYQKTNGSIFKIIYMKNQHNRDVPVITYIHLKYPNVTDNIQNFFWDYVRGDDYVLKTLYYPTDPYPQFEEFNNPPNVSYIYYN